MHRRRIVHRTLSRPSPKHNSMGQSCHLVAVGVFLTIVLVVLMEPLDSSTFQSMAVSLPSEVDELRSYSVSSSDTIRSDKRYKKTSSSPNPIRTIIRPTSLPFPLPIPRDMHVDKLLPKLLLLIRKTAGHRQHGRLVNLGAGVREDDPTYYLLDDPNDQWEALLADGAKDQGEIMAKRFPNERIKTIVAYIMASTAPPLLSQHGFDQDLDLLKIDIDSFDCRVVESLFKARIRPAVIVMEVNVKFPANVRFAFLPGLQTSSSEQYPFDSDRRGHVYGCSLAYQLYDLMRPHGYEILYLDKNNAVYFDKQKQDLPAGLKEEYSPLSMKDLYDRGYWNMPNRKSLFPFNKELEIWQTYQADQIFSHLQKKPLISHGHHRVVIGDLVPNGSQPALQSGCFDPESGVLKKGEC